MTKKKKNLIEEIEKRYDVEFYRHSDDTIKVYVCKDLISTPERENHINMGDTISFKWSSIPFDFLIDKRRLVEELDVKIDDIKDSGSIYDISKTGFKSHFHPKYEDMLKDYGVGESINTEGVYNSFHPYIGLTRKIKGESLYCFFRMDNPMIRELFYDTEGLVLKTKDLHPDGKTKDMDNSETDSFFNHRKEEHKEYLHWFFNGRGSEWIKIYFEKCNEPNTKEMLHKEYLKSRVL